jgi:hypothetical protein
MYLAWYYYCMKNNLFRQFVLRGSFMLLAHGRVGARATVLAAHFAKQKRPEAEQARYGVKNSSVEGTKKHLHRCFYQHPIWLAWQDSFRTFEWLGELADPVTIIKQTRQLLVLVQS